VSQWLQAVKEASPLALLMCLLTIGNANFDQAKDVMVLNVLGAKYIPFLQVYAVLPLSVGFLWGYQLVQRMLPRRGLFPVIISTFVLVKLVAAHFLLPQALVTISAAPAAASLGGWVDLVTKVKVCVIPAVFYGFCELYGDVVLGVLFWGFAIQATASKNIKRLLPLYCVGANLAQILVGVILQQISKTIPGAMHQIQVPILLLLMHCLQLLNCKEVLMIAGYDLHVSEAPGASQ
jgi:ATP:ADP antiporter, AAA family